MPIVAGSGGAINNTGGAVGAGGNTPGSGGTVSSGGTASSTGGSVTGGSTPGNGGSVSAGGSVTTGGAPGAGGQANGGNTTTGGNVTGGIANNGGSTATGGRAVGGGGKAVGGGTTVAAGGVVSTGGAVNSTGGAVSNTGGSSAGGSTAGGTSGSCARTVGSCSAPTVNLTDVTLPNAVVGYGGEGDTVTFPMAIAPLASGGSYLAWMGTDKNVYVGTLGCDDKLTGTPFKFPGIDLQDVIADSSGGAVLLTRDATNGGTDNCGTGTLCGGSSSPCRTMWLVKFDSAGNVQWETQVTNLSSSLAGYQNGARFIWWYQHHGRLAYSGSNYAAFFGVAITVNNGSCVDIHEGDRLQIVSGSGALVSSGSLEVGMSHAWTSRILWDSRTSKFAATDATDNSCRIANPFGPVTIGASSCDGKLFNGDIVKSTTAGYWDAWSNAGSIQLAHFSTGTTDKTVTGLGSSQHPHLVSYGANNMLLVYAASTAATSVTAQVLSADASATAVGSTFTISINDHDYGSWKAWDDGSAAYAASGTGSTGIKIARVMPCN